MENKIQQEIRCKRCGSGQTYIKLSTMERICRTCANIEKIKSIKTKKELNPSDSKLGDTLN